MEPIEYYLLHGVPPSANNAPLTTPAGDTRTFQNYDPSNSIAKSQLNEVVKQFVQSISDPFYAFTPGDEPRQTASRDRIVKKVAQAMTDPMAATFVPAKGAEVGAFSDLLASRARMARGGAPVTMREIADDAMRLRTEDAVRGGENIDKLDGLLAETVRHPELFKEQPRLMSGVDAHIKYGPGLRDEFHGGNFDGNQIVVRAPVASKAREITGHETQHAVQEHADWPRGGSPYGPDAVFPLRDRFRAGDSIIRKDGDKWFMDYEGKSMEITPESANRIWLERGERDFKNDNYFNLHGEEQARRTARRMDKPLEERVGKPYGDYDPTTYRYSDTDVPNAYDLIMRFGNGIK